MEYLQNHTVGSTPDSVIAPPLIDISPIDLEDWLKFEELAPEFTQLLSETGGCALRDAQKTIDLKEKKLRE